MSTADVGVAEVRPNVLHDLTLPNTLRGLTPATVSPGGRRGRRAMVVLAMAILAIAVTVLALLGGGSGR